MKRIALLLLVLFVFAGCDGDTQTQTVTVVQKEDISRIGNVVYAIGRVFEIKDPFNLHIRGGKGIHFFWVVVREDGYTDDLIVYLADNGAITFNTCFTPAEKTAFLCVYDNALVRDERN